ncbi:glutamate-5-semialdehyde dehydrogenase [Flavihumibacter petaseus]|uniref:Gamma-glutamyl phosphate reductase n=1 Tax=Flavihumibacter petaseus NBRC 106054 TaxID=1220578 RepID=A0A0E9MZM6_9BACT|nr:glutamate-5-semialdehyde dehydrogenase [Flavihumibacter petaseus]GAO43207.1 gamma-glutamyl phosphate reductase [Flavihumibacter petaseus NBRC 106054]
MPTTLYYSDTMTTVKDQLLTAHHSRRSLQQAPGKKIRKCLLDIAKAILKQETEILAANQLDLDNFDLNDPKRDRLLLNRDRLQEIANGVRAVADLPDPTGQVLLKRSLSNGLKLRKVTVPLGVVGAIYESRPNVTFDIAALCLRSRNVAVLKGSSEARHTNFIAVTILQSVLNKHQLDPDCITLLPAEREVVDELLHSPQYVDVIIPRGSDGLIQYVRRNSLVPVIETGAGVCHVYVDREADLEKAVAIVVNAKTSRPSVCNAMDTLLLDKKIAEKTLRLLAKPMADAGVRIFAEAGALPFLKGYPMLEEAQATDYDREFLSLQCAVKIVDGLPEALDHIDRHSTKHSEAIVTENKTTARAFLDLVDAAAVYSNASTRFTDGAEFGLGAEIGISTQKLHARGPFALEKLVTEKWIIQGKGQVR